jgi:hypothetical protein
MRCGILPVGYHLVCHSIKKLLLGEIYYSKLHEMAIFSSANIVHVIYNVSLLRCDILTALHIIM